MPTGLQRLKLPDSLQSCNAVIEELFSVPGSVQPGILQDHHTNTFSNLTQNGGNRSHA